MSINNRYADVDDAMGEFPGDDDNNKQSYE